MSVRPRSQAALITEPKRSLARDLLTIAGNTLGFFFVLAVLLATLVLMGEVLAPMVP